VNSKLLTLEFLLFQTKLRLNIYSFPPDFGCLLSLCEFVSLVGFTRLKVKLREHFTNFSVRRPFKINLRPKMFLYTYIYMKWVKSCYSFFTSLEKVLILGVRSFFFSLLILSMCCCCILVQSLNHGQTKLFVQSMVEKTFQLPTFGHLDLLMQLCLLSKKLFLLVLVAVVACGASPGKSLSVCARRRDWPKSSLYILCAECGMVIISKLNKDSVYLRALVHK